MFFKYDSFNKTHIIKVVKLTYHGGQIIYIIYIKIFYDVTDSLQLQIIPTFNYNIS